jgi:gag-polypeptide of LTR copia-type/Domain of unknown function (DUF4219)
MYEEWLMIKLYMIIMTVQINTYFNYTLSIHLTSLKFQYTLFTTIIFLQVMSPMGEENSAGEQIPLLDGTNYPTWKLKMESYLQSKGLAKFLSSNGYDLMQDQALSREKRMDLEDASEKALGHIRRHVDGNHQEMLIKTKNARSAWRALKKHYEGKEVYNKVQLLQRFFEEGLNEGQEMIKAVPDYLQSKKEIVRRLQAVGLTIPEELLVAVILARLPTSCDITRRILESNPDISLAKVSQGLNAGGNSKRNQTKVGSG